LYFTHNHESSARSMFGVSLFISHFIKGPRLWYLIDAKNMIPGRLASTIVPILMGKHKPIYNPASHDCGDNVIVINAKDVHLTGEKWTQKKYRWHTGHPGGLKEFTAEKYHERDPIAIMKTAISRMLPKNKMRKIRESRLHVYPDDQHPYVSQQPIVYEPLGVDAVYKNIDY
jgi:large subunit ribosomal protein L13